VNGLNASQKIIDAKDMGVKFNKDIKRDDIKSSVLDILHLKRKIEHKDQQSFWALKDITFKGFKGEIIGIIGSNGAGKSTLCRVISKLLRPDAGTMQVRGEVSALLSLGTGFNIELSGKENIYLNAMMLGFNKKQINSLYNEIVEFAGLGEFIEQPIKYYSSGMKSRLGFSIAAMLEPEILVLDEALSTGDISFRDKAAAKMKEIVHNAKMVLIVSHSIDFIEKNCTKAIWIDKGTVRVMGEPKTVCEQYKLEAAPKVKRKKIIVNLKKTEKQAEDETVIKVSNLGIQYNLKNKKFWALKNVDFSVKKGEIIGIIGHNGAGKSTLCKVLSKIYKPDEGSVHINGDVAALLSFGTGFNNQLSGNDNIYLNGLMLGLTKQKIKQVHNDIVSFSELDKFINNPVKTYSSGMRSRLGFSIASMIEPDVFIIDEALSVGDINFYEKASARMQEMILNSKAVIVVTHSMEFVEKVCTRAIWINKGELIYDGDPKETVVKYMEEQRVR
jgi:teichoic acid transport system ATP-binding protein